MNRSPLLRLRLGCLKAGIVLAASGLAGCSAQTDSDLTLAKEQPQPAPNTLQLEHALELEFARLGIDPSRVAAEAPKTGSEVFDLTLEPVFDGLGGPRVGVRLLWTERLVGDYDCNGEVGITDLTPIGLNFQQTVAYDPAEEHAGLSWWPLGDPLDDGGVIAELPPAADSPAANWVRARVDGDANGVITINDLTPIAINWRSRLDGYRIYRRREGESTFALLPDPRAELADFTIARGDAIGAEGSQPDSRRPVRYEFLDSDPGAGEVEYLVAPYDSNSASEGPLSISPEGSGNVQASFTLDPSAGPAPLTVLFDASASVALLGTITEYRWDFYNDGTTDFISTDSALASETYLENGTYVVVLRVSTDLGDTGVAAQVVQVGSPPQAVLVASPPGGEVPLQVRFDASSSTASLGSIEQYEWDTDNNGSYDLNTGPVPFYDVDCAAAGTLEVSVRVTDSVGLSGTDSLQIGLTDNYDETEPNDSALQAMELGTLAPGGSSGPLSGSLGQAGYDGDASDWFRFRTSSAGLVTVTLDFAAADAELNLYLYDSGGSPQLASAVTAGDGEVLSWGLRHSAEYFVECRRVSGGGSAADYTLSLGLASLPLDEDEPNNSADQASSLGFVTGSTLPGFWGSVSPANSEDWYKFSISAPASLTVVLSFYHLDADLDLQVYDASGVTLLGESRSVDDNEEAVLPELPAGTYTIRCFRFQGGSAYYSLGFLLN